MMSDSHIMQGDVQPGPLAVDRPLFLHIPVGRLIWMSIASFGLYEMYWMYKNLQYVRDRDGVPRRPFLRAVFGVFYCHRLLRRMHADPQSRAILQPSFS